MDQGLRFETVDNAACGSYGGDVSVTISKSRRHSIGVPQTAQEPPAPGQISSVMISSPTTRTPESQFRSGNQSTALSFDNYTRNPSSGQYTTRWATQTNSSAAHSHDERSLTLES